MSILEYKDFIYVNSVRKVCLLTHNPCVEAFLLDNIYAKGGFMDYCACPRYCAAWSY